MSKKTTDIVAYLSPIGLLIALIAGDRTASRHHLNQSLVLWIAGILLEFARRILLILPFVDFFVGLIAGLLSFVLFIFWIIGFASALSGTEKEIPILGAIHLL